MRIQIAVALITFLLIKMAHIAQSAIDNLTTFARPVGATVMHRQHLEHLRRSGPAPDPGPIQNNRQLALLWP